MFASAAEEQFEATVALERELAELTGVLNATHGKIVATLAQALAGGLWKGHRIHSPGHWLAWKCGMAPQRANQVVKLAERLAELPATTGALAEGALSVDQAVEIARHVPAEFERGVCSLATLCTVEQLRRVLPSYRFRAELAEARSGKATEPDPAAEAGADASAEQPGGRPQPVEERRDFAMGTDDEGWWLSGHLPLDEGALVERAIRTAREDRYREQVAGLGPDDPTPSVGLVDGLVGMAEASLRAGQAAHPGSDRYTIYAHLEAGPGGANVASLHLGPVLPDHLRRLHTCDGTLRPVLERDGVPCNVGRDERIVPRRVRRLIERRDDGCRVPGCPRRVGIEVHHIIHWEDGGATDTANLVALCASHHRTHHLGALGITGDADHPDAPGGLRFTDRWGRPLEPVGTPAVPDPDLPLCEAAEALGATPGTYRHPLGECLDPSAVLFFPDPPAAPPPEPAPEIGGGGPTTVPAPPGSEPGSGPANAQAPPCGDPSRERSPAA